MPDQLCDWCGHPRLHHGGGKRACLFGGCHCRQFKVINQPAPKPWPNTGAQPGPVMPQTPVVQQPLYAQSNIPCDVVITSHQEVFLNGVQIGMVMDLITEVKPNDLVTCIMKFNPTSVVCGDPPVQPADGDEIQEDPHQVVRLDMSKIMKRVAQRRRIKGDMNSNATDDSTPGVEVPPEAGG